MCTSKLPQPIGEQMENIIGCIQMENNYWIYP
jgi:hypothetical protein